MKNMNSKKMIHYLIAFLIPFFVGVLMFYVKGIAPFGDQSLLCMDLWGQYFPMYVQQAKVGSINELFYSWNGALGYNNWAQNAYYCNSLFFILFRFFPVEQMVNLLDWICLIKIGLSSAACLAFLNYKTKKNSPVLVAGAVSYSLCSYMLAYISQPMWTDLLIYAPLVLLGVERLIQEKKALFYSFILALAIISNFYIGYSLCLFTAVYFMCNAVLILKRKRYVNENGKRAVKVENGIVLGRMVLSFAFYSLMAGAMAAVVIIPTLKAISNTVASELQRPEKIEWYDSFIAYLRMMLPGQKLNLGYTGSNISTGILGIFLLPLYFCNKRIRKMERLVNGGFLLFLLISMNCNILDYVWHGFHFPNQLPGRWTFLFSLLVVILGSTGVINWEGLSIKRIMGGLGFGYLLIVLAVFGKDYTYIGRRYYIIIILATVMIIIAALCRRKDKTRKLAMAGIVLLSGLQICDAGSNFVAVASMENGGIHTSGLSAYNSAVKRISSWGEEWKSEEDEFYRVEAYPGFTFNPSMLGDYKGVGYYSSTMQGDTYQMLRFLGNRVYAENVSSVYNIDSIVQNSILGIKYFLDFNHNLNSTLPGAALISENDECDIWENPYVLPVAFGVSTDILDWEVTDEIRAVQNQNELLNKMCGEDVNVFQKMYTTGFSYTNATLDESMNWNQNYFYAKDAGKPVKFYYTYTCIEDAPVYLEHNYRAGTITVSSNNGERTVSVNNERFCCLGEFKAGDVITIEVEIENIQIGCCGLNLYEFDMAAWQEAYKKLSAQALTLKEFAATSLSGIINMKEEGIVFTSIPQDEGWTVTCDGEKAEEVLIGDTLIGIRVPKGSHILRMSYSVPGLKMGLLISMIGLLLTVVSDKLFKAVKLLK